MEAAQKKRGFFTSKLPKPFSSRASRKVSHTDQNMAKVNYSTIPMVSSRPTGSNQHGAVSYIKPPSFYDHHGDANKKWGRGDENVDSMADTFISDVRQRFKLDGVEFDK